MYIFRLANTEHVEEAIARIDYWYCIFHRYVDLLHDIVDRPYWNRIWIVQEIEVAKEVMLMCGPDMISFVDFRKVLHKNAPYTDSTYGESSNATVIPTLDFLRDDYLKQTLTCLADAIMSTGNRCASDPRDQVYGLLDLVTSGSGQDIEVDSTISPCRVCCKAICAITKDWNTMHHGHLCYLLRALQNKKEGIKQCKVSIQLHQLLLDPAESLSKHVDGDFKKTGPCKVPIVLGDSIADTVERLKLESLSA